MRQNSKEFFLLIVLLLSLLSVACTSAFGLDSLFGKEEEPTVSTEPIVSTEQIVDIPSQVNQPTRQPRPTKAPTSIPEPTQAPTSVPEPTQIPVVEDESEPYYTEEFDVVPDNWYFEVLRGNEDKTDITAGDGVLSFDIQDYDTYAYVFYEDWLYEDVYLEASVTNRGYNDNMITLVCRYSDSGFYEVNIDSGGLYDIYAYTSLINQGYHRLYNGGSLNINMGLKSNEFAMSCEDNEISLYVNGHHERTIKDTTYNLPEGLIGVGVSSFSNVPVIVDFNYVTIDLP